MTKKDKQKSILLLAIAIGAVTLLEGLAILKGLNGKYFALALSAIVGAAGFTLRGLLK